MSDDFYEEHFDELYSLPQGSEPYVRAQTEFYIALREDCRYSEKDAMQVARELDKGNVAEAEELVEEVLEQDDS